MLREGPAQGGLGGIGIEFQLLRGRIAHGKTIAVKIHEQLGNSRTGAALQLPSKKGDRRILTAYQHAHGLEGFLPVFLR